jgi:hypothetical protein
VPLDRHCCLLLVRRLKGLLIERIAGVVVIVVEEGEGGNHGGKWPHDVAIDDWVLLSPPLLYRI